jgi:alcohol dehydrogenase (cytochrome c)
MDRAVRLLQTANMSDAANRRRQLSRNRSAHSDPSDGNCTAASRMKLTRPVLAILVVVIFFGMIGAAAVYWQPDYWKSSLGLRSAANGRHGWIACRLQIYLQKAQGGIPELSWTDLWAMTRSRSGFNCSEGESIGAGLRFSSNASEDDRAAGGRIFRKRCAPCHGRDGTGGPVGPSLVRSEYVHGDSDLAIFQVLRHGIPGTAMPKAALPTRGILQVVAYIKMLQAHSSDDHKPEKPRLAIHVSDERLRTAGSRTDEWLTYSGSYNGWRHTPLAEITPANVARLRLRWVTQFNIADQNIEATPLVIDGTIFIVADAGHVLALDAKTGKEIWHYTRSVPPDLPLEYGLANRGLAVHGSTLFFGSIDGYLVALDADDGKVIWQRLVASPSGGYSITAAPLVINHSVVVGISGGEFRIRGFLAAYDVSTGRQQWKFDTIPGPGAVGHDTWKNDAWRTGGGGTWITGSYDPSTDLLYWGVGNPSPAFAGDARPGDNLFTASVIALHASTGKLAWYFQFTPHDEHDRDAAQTPVLANLPIGGILRKVICWPNRNGFYYVLDRVTGQFLAGIPFVKVDWAKGLTATGRPILSDAAMVSTAGRSARPGIAGGTNWQNPAFDPQRGSIFIPASESSSVFTKAPADQALDGAQNRVFIGSGWSQVGPVTHEVVALDAATGRLDWKYTANNGSSDLDHSGLLATAGGLVFGASEGVLFALNADTGRELWRASLGGTTKAAPISFTIDGRQMIAVSAGRALFVFGL